MDRCTLRSGTEKSWWGFLKKRVPGRCKFSKFCIFLPKSVPLFGSFPGIPVPHDHCWIPEFFLLPKISLRSAMIRAWGFAKTLEIPVPAFGRIFYLSANMLWSGTNFFLSPTASARQKKVGVVPWKSIAGNGDVSFYSGKQGH